MVTIGRVLRISKRAITLDRAFYEKLHEFFASNIRLTYNRFLDYRYCGENLCGVYYTPFHTSNGAKRTQSSDYYGLRFSFRLFDLNENTTVTDIGCGQGRAILWLVKHFKLKKIYGIELCEDVAEETTTRLKNYQNVSILKGNALELIPDDTDVFFLWNPFTQPIVAAFKAKLEETFHNKKEIVILYHFPAHLLEFINDDRWEIEYHKLQPKWFRWLLCFHFQDTAIIRLKNTANL